MWTDYKLLLRKELKDKLAFFRKSDKKKDVLGIIFSVILSLGFIAVFVAVFRELVLSYCNIKLFGRADVAARQFEILSLAYTLVLIFGVFSGVKKINNSINGNRDMPSLVILPVSMQAVFLSKLTWIFLSQLAAVAMIIIPVNVTFYVITAQAASYLPLTVVLCLLLSVISLLISSVLALPSYYAVRFLKSKFVLLTVLFAVGMGLAFYVYYIILGLLKSMLETGTIQFFFNDQALATIATLAKYAYPCNLLAEIVLGRNLLRNFLIILAVVAICGTGVFFIVKAMFAKLAQRQLEGDRYIFKTNTKIKRSPVILALIRKEFFTVLRTPSYAFQYFATTLTLPLMVFCCLSLSSSLLERLVFINCNFELSIVIITMFSVLTNTFCAGNISREGSMFVALKAMPFAPKEILFSKVLFCSITSLLSILVSCVVAAIGGYINAWQCIYVFFITSLLSLAEVFFATRKDFNRPQIQERATEELEDSNSTISLIVVLGLLISVVLGAVTLYSSIVLKTLKGDLVGTLVSIGTVSAIAALLFGGALAYLLVGLNKKYYSIGG